jgi:hypothetical protein
MHPLIIAMCNKPNVLFRCNLLIVHAQQFNHQPRRAHRALHATIRGVFVAA